MTTDEKIEVITRIVAEVCGCLKARSPSEQTTKFWDRCLTELHSLAPKPERCEHKHSVRHLAADTHGYQCNWQLFECVDCHDIGRRYAGTLDVEWWPDPNEKAREVLEELYREEVADYGEPGTRTTQRIKAKLAELSNDA